MSLDEHTVKELRASNENRSRQSTYSPCIDRLRQIPPARVGRDCSRPEQYHRPPLEVGTPGYVCRCTGLFRGLSFRLFIDRMGCQAARPLRTGRWHSRLPPVDANCASACWSELGGCVERELGGCVERGAVRTVEWYFRRSRHLSDQCASRRGRRKVGEGTLAIVPIKAPV